MFSVSRLEVPVQLGYLKCRGEWNWHHLHPSCTINPLPQPPSLIKFGVPLELSEVQLSFSNTPLCCVFAEICSQMSAPTLNSEGLRWNTSTLLVFHPLSNFECVGGKLKQHLPSTYWLLAWDKAVYI